MRTYSCKTDKLRDVYGPQARNRLNQVVEAKMFEGLFYVEKRAEFKNQTLQKFGWDITAPRGMQYAEFKNQTLKNRLVHKSAMRNGIPQGMQYLKIALKWGYHCRFIL